MASTLVSEDLVRTLSCLVFACIPPGKSTIKLFDPVSGELEEYHLEKVSSDSSTASTSVGPPPKQAKKAAGLILQDVMQRLKAVEGSKTSQCKVDSVSHHGIDGPLARLKRVFYHCDDSADSPLGRSAFAAVPPGWVDRTYLLDQTIPWESDTEASGNWSAPSTPLKLRSSSSSSWCSSLSSPASRLAPGDSSSPFDTTCSTSGDASRLVGLGFSMFNTDGTPFDGLGTLDDSPTRAPSPTDEARARVCQRRGVRGGAAHSPMLFEPRPKSHSTPRSPSKPARHAAEHPSPKDEGEDDDSDDCFGAPPGASTPVPPMASASESARVPQAPARRVLGRLPIEFNFPKVQEKEAKAKTRRSPGQALGAPFHGHPRRECCSGSAKKRSPVNAAMAQSQAQVGTSTPEADRLRFWTHWMTPASEKDGRARAVWRP